MSRGIKVVIGVLAIICLGFVTFLIIYRPGKKVGPLEKMGTWETETVIFDFYYTRDDMAEDELKKLAVERLDSLLGDYQRVNVSILFDRGWAREISSARAKRNIMGHGGEKKIIVSWPGNPSGGVSLTAPIDTSIFTLDTSQVLGDYVVEIIPHPSNDIWMVWYFKK